ncbi:MAG TPA: calcium-binding protein [Thermoleophilaceae bacterium]|nr:calcium-binding protein [Thermoleophilaceae bacterium]
MTRNRLASLVAAAAIACLPAAPAAAAERWVDAAAGPIATPAPNQGFDLKRIGGRPHLAWTESTGGVLQVRVARIEADGDVEPLGAAPVNHDPERDAYGPSLASGPGDVPWITWIEKDEHSAWVRAARFSASENRWVEPLPNARINDHPERVPDDDLWLYSAVQAKTVFVSDRLHLVFRQNGLSEYRLGHVRLAADGRSWERLSPPPRQSPYGVTAHVAEGTLHVGTLNYPDFQTTVDRLSAAGTWEPVGGGSVNSSLPDSPSGSMGHLAHLGSVIYATWGPYNSSGQVARWTGSGAWQDAGTPGGAHHIRIVGGRVLTSWTDAAGLHVSRLESDGSGWEPTPGPIGPTADDVSGGVLTGVAGVAHVAFLAGGELRLWRLEGSVPAGPDDFDDSDPPGDGAGGGGSGGDHSGPPPSPPDPPPGPPAGVRGPCGFQILGTSAANLLTGDAARNTIHGLAGDDRILGLGQADCLFGGPANDRLDGGAGADRLDGGPGRDRLLGGGSEDRLFGGSGNDRLEGGTDEDLLSGGAGRDVLIGGPGYDRVKAGAGNDVIDATGRGFDRVDCGPGRDRVRAGTADRLRNCERVAYVD